MCRKGKLTTAFIGMWLAAQAAPGAAQNDWQTQRVTDPLTDEQSLVSTKAYPYDRFELKVQFVCIAPRAFAYRFTLLSETGVDFFHGGDDSGLTTVTVRLDDDPSLETIETFEKQRSQTDPVLEIAAMNLKQDYLDTVRTVAGEQISGKNDQDWDSLVQQYSIPDRPNPAIWMAAMARSKIRVSLPTTRGDAVAVIDQNSPGPALVLRNCGLSHSKFVADVNDTETKTVGALRQLAVVRKKSEAENEAKAAEDEKYNMSDWPHDPTVAMRGLCQVVTSERSYQSPCRIEESSETLSLYGVKPDYAAMEGWFKPRSPADLSSTIPDVHLRVSGDQAFGLIAPDTSESSRTGVLTKDGTCWRGTGFLICAQTKGAWTW